MRHCRPTRQLYDSKSPTAIRTAQRACKNASTRIYERRQDAQKPFDLLYAEAQRFFRDAGFSLATTGETDSFLCAPARPNWQKYVKTPVYTRVVAAKRLTSEDVLNVRDAARAAVANATIAFVLVDKDPKDDALLQIITERLNGTTVVPVPASLLYDCKSSGKPDPAYVALSEHLRDLLGGADPYSKSSPVTDRMNFVGRDTLAETLMKDMLENGKHIGVFGLRKMGKSSLLRYMQYRMPCPTAWLDLQKGADLAGVYERALQGWQSDAQSRFGIDLGLSGVKVGAADPSADFVKALGEALRKLGQNSALPAHVALFLDEIEQLMPSSGAGQEEATLALKLMRTLRGLAQEDGTITLMVAGVDPAIIRLSRIGEAQNPFFQLLDEVYLPPISDDACRQLVRNLGALIELNYTGEALDAIVQASGGHPFFARRLCSLLYEKRGRQSGEVVLDEVKEGIEDFIYDQKYAAVMDDNGLWGAEVGNARIWGEPIARSNQRILETLSKAKDPQTEPALTEATTANSPTERANRRQSLTMLNKLAVVRDQRELPRPDPLYRITFGLFRQWIRQVHLGLDE